MSGNNYQMPNAFSANVHDEPCSLNRYYGFPMTHEQCIVFIDTIKNGSLAAQLRNDGGWRVACKVRREFEGQRDWMSITI